MLVCSQTDIQSRVLQPGPRANLSSTSTQPGLDPAGLMTPAGPITGHNSRFDFVRLHVTASTCFASCGNLLTVISRRYCCQ
jgi:hypothetical protein